LAWMEEPRRLSPPIMGSVVIARLAPSRLGRGRVEA